MKISKETQEILKNFTGINESIYFNGTNILSTISPYEDIFATTTIDEKIPECAIYQLSRFLGVISLFNNPDIDFQTNKCTITQGEKNVTYAYTDKDNIIVPPADGIPEPEWFLEFKLTTDDFKSLLQASRVMDFPDFVIEGKAGNIIVSVRDNRNKNSDVYEIKVGEIDKEFVNVIGVENMSKLIPLNYIVKLSEDSAKFICDNYNDGNGLTYYVCFDAE
jgi:hypothetical protein